MSATPYVVSALVIAGVASTAGIALSHHSRPAEPVICELHLTEARRQVTVIAEAEARQPAAGTYTLEIDQRSGAGRSSVRQEGEFDLKAGERTTLGEAQFTGRARDVDARLTLTSDGKTRHCDRISL